MSRRSKLTPYHSQVGTVPDREIAKRAGCSIATVCHYRQRHNIPSYRSQLAPAALEVGRATDSPAQPVLVRSSEDSALQGYAATMQTDQGSQEVYLIARDIVEAAERASKEGIVSGLSYISPALVAP